MYVSTYNHIFRKDSVRTSKLPTRKHSFVILLKFCFTKIRKFTVFYIHLVYVYDVLRKYTTPADVLRKYTIPDVLRKYTIPDVQRKYTIPDVQRKYTIPDVLRKYTIPDV